MEWLICQLIYSLMMKYDVNFGTGRIRDSWLIIWIQWLIDFCKIFQSEKSDNLIGNKKFETNEFKYEQYGY